MNVNRSSSSIESARDVELAGMLCGPFAAAGAQRVELVERDHVAGEALDLRALLVVLDEHADRLGMVEDVPHVVRRADE